MRILVIAPSWIGDLVMSQCLYMELKKIHPEAEIDVMAPKWCHTNAVRTWSIQSERKIPPRKRTENKAL